MSESTNKPLGIGGSGTPVIRAGKTDSPQSPARADRPSFPYPERQIATKAGVHVRLLQKARQGLRAGEHWAIQCREVAYSQTGMESICAALDLPSDSLLALMRKNAPAAAQDARSVQVLRTPTTGNLRNARMLHCSDEKGDVWVRIDPRWADLFKPGQSIQAQHDPSLNIWTTQKPRQTRKR